MSNCVLLLLVSRLSSGTRNISSKQDEPINFAEFPSGAHTEETFEDIEEVELDEAWDLSAAEDAPTLCLSEHEEENIGSE